MNGFKKHGIDHLSASSINMFANAPCAWVAKYLFGRKFNFALAARAGVLVEDAVANIITDGMAIDDAIDFAVSAYNKQCAIGGSASDIKRGEGISGMIKIAVDELSKYGEPEYGGSVTKGREQKKIEITCKGDGWSIPVIGYLDFDFPAHGLVVDLKTTMAAPSNMSDEHIRQGAIYRFAKGNAAVKFLYVTPKKAVWHEIDEPKPVLEEIKIIATRMERLLRLDAEQIKDIVPVIASSYYWSGDEAARQELYGF